MTQKETIKNHLLKHKEITSKQAIELYSVTRLSAIIYELREEGMNIDTSIEQVATRYEHKANIARYILGGINVG